MNGLVDKITKLALTALMLLALFAVPAEVLTTRADINPLYNFKGRITDSSNMPVADGVYNFSFGLFAQPTGGAAVWSETLDAANLFSATISSSVTNADSIVYTYAGAANTNTLRVGQPLNSGASTATIIDFNTGANTVTVTLTGAAWANGASINNRPRVDGGIADINLGAVTDPSNVDFDQPLYLEVTFNGETMLPRKNIVGVPQAFNAAKLGGRSATDFGSITSTTTVTGLWNFANDLNIATSSNTTALSVSQDGSGRIAEFKNGGLDVLSILANGNVGIGTSTPSSMLTVGGTAGSQFLVNSTGVVTAGTWNGGVIGVDYGGTGNSFYTAGSILYASGTTTLTQLPIGTIGQVLAVSASGTPYWTVVAGTHDAVTFAGSYSYLSLNNQQITLNAINLGSDVTGVLSVSGGGTGTSTAPILGQLLIGDGLGGYSLAATSTLGFAAAGHDHASVYEPAFSLLPLTKGGLATSTVAFDGLVKISSGATSYITDNSANWNTAFGWGNHTAAGYLTSFTELDPIFGASEANKITAASTTNWNTAYSWGDHAAAGYLTGFVEADPLFGASAAAGITATNTANWNTAYGWGDHALMSYITDGNTNWDNSYGYITSSSAETLTNKTWQGNIIGSSYLPVAVVYENDSITRLTNNAGYITATSSDALANKSGNISMWTNNTGYITSSSAETLTNKGGSISMWTNDSGYLTSYVETDPIFSVSTAAGITAASTTDWTTAFGWGNHALMGYITDGNMNWDNTYGYITSSSAETLTNKTWQGSAVGQAYGGTGTSSVGWTGYAFVSGGNWSATSSLPSGALPSNLVYQGDDISWLVNNIGYITSSSAETLTNKAGLISMWSNDAGYLTSFTETDPLFGASTAAGITATNTANWTTAYGWGDHATYGYITDGNMNWDNSYGYITSSSAETLTNKTWQGNIIGSTYLPVAVVYENDNITRLTNNAGYITSSSAETLTNKSGNISMWTNDSGYLTSYVETDPIYSVSAAAAITAASTTEWSTAYTWGNHALSGYLTSFTETDPIFGASEANKITAASTTDWNAAYGWGNHALAGYISDGNTNWDNLYSFITASSSDTLTNKIWQGSAIGLAYGGLATSTTAFDGLVKISSGAASYITDNSANWNTAFGWGDHSAAGYLTSFTETDPIFGASEANNITAASTTEWTTAYGWGDHATYGYITDGNTNWDNSYGYITSSSAETLTNKTWNGNIIGSTYLPVAVVYENDNITRLANNAGYITSSSAETLTNKSGNISMWTNDSGYLTSYVETDPIYSVSAAASITAASTTEWSTAYTWGNHALAGYITDGNTNWDNTYGFITASSTEILTNKTWQGNAIGVAYGGTGTSTQFAPGSIVFAGAGGVYSQNNSNLFWDNTNNYLGLGTSTPQAVLDITDSSMGAVYGAEMITNAADRDFSSATGNWSGTNWSISGGVASHASATNTVFTLNNAALSVSPEAGKMYLVAFTVNTTVAGSISITFGNGWVASVGQAVGGITMGQVVEATNANPLTFSPNATWTGTLDNISITEVTPSRASQVVRNADGSVDLEMRVGGSRGNTFVGLKAGGVNINGSTNDNSFFGSNAGFANTIGHGNSFFGSDAGGRNNAGYYNTFIGARAGLSSLYGDSNVAVGWSALVANVGGGDNVAVGRAALYNSTHGSQNVALGRWSLFDVTTASNNIAIGYDAGGDITTGSSNITIGTDAGDNITTGGTNIILGHNIDAPSGTASNQLSIGNLIFGSGGFGSGTSIGAGNVGIGSSSPVARLAVKGAAGSTPLFDVSSSTNASLFRIISTGNVGIGTSTPSAMLTVGAASSQQFLVNNIGQVTAGTWQGSAIGQAYGGTGTSSADWTGYAFVNNGTWSATSSLPSGALPSNLVYQGDDISWLVNNAGYITSSSAETLTNKSGNISMWTNDSGYLTSYVETDPIYSVSAAAAITAASTTNWELAYTWGSHALAGYITDGNTGWDNSYGFITASSSETLTNKTWNGNVIGVAYGGTGTSTQFAPGSIVFAGADGTYAQNNANLFWNDAGNYLRLGSAPYSIGVDATDSNKFKIFPGDGVAGTSAFSIDTNGVTSIASLSMGTQEFAADSGMINWIDMPVTGAAANGSVQSYTAQLDGNPMLSIYGTSDGAGGTANRSVRMGAPLGLIETGATSTYYSYLQGGDQVADITYTLPTASTNGLLRNTGGVWSWDNTSYLSGVVGAANGGFGTTTAGWTGLAFANSGVWTATTSLGLAYGGLGTSTAAFDGLVKISGGVVSNITDNSDNWNMAYGWGNHASSSYITDGNTNWDNSYGYITATSSETLSNKIWQGGVIAIAYGGTGTSTAPGLNQLLLGNGAGGYNLVSTSSLGFVSGSVVSSLTGTAAQVIVSASSGAVTLSLPQDIANTSNPTFAGLSLSGLTSGSLLFAAGGGLISQDNANFFYDSINHRLGLGTTNPQESLDIFGAGKGLRLSYDGSNFVSLASNASGELTITSSATSSDSAVIIGNGLNQDISMIFDASTTDYHLGIDASDNKFKFGLGQIMGTSTLMTVDSSGRLGIGTTTPAERLSVIAPMGSNIAEFVQDTGNRIVIGNGDTGIPHLNFVSSQGNTNLSISPNDGGDNSSIFTSTNFTFNPGGADNWFGIGFDGGADATAKLEVDGNGGSIDLFKISSDADNLPQGNILTIKNNGFVGIGTSSPSSLLTVGATTTQQFLVNNLGVVTGGTWQGNAVGVAYGGTGTSTAPALGQLLMGNGTGGYSLVSTSSLGFYSGSVVSSLTGTAAQVIVSATSGAITLSLPQNIANTSNPTFAGLSLSGLTSGSLLFAAGGGLISQDNANFFYDSANHRLGLGTTNPQESLDIFGAGKGMRLSYDLANYVNLSSNSSGQLTITSSATSSESAVIVGTGLAQDALVLLKGSSTNYYIGQDATDNLFKIGAGSEVGTSTFLAINLNGNITMGTTSALSTNRLTIDGGDMLIAGMPSATSTRSLFTLSGPLAAGNPNGTFFGANPASFTGDFIEFEVNGSTVFNVGNGTASQGNVVANVYGAATFNPSTGGVEYGNVFNITNAPTTATNTAIGQIINLGDNSGLANTTYGLIAETDFGSNLAGVQTGIMGVARTYGVYGRTDGSAYSLTNPAGVYGHYVGTATGSAIRAFSSSITSASLLSLGQNTSAFSGSGLLMNFGAPSGSFTGRFMDLQKNNTTYLYIDSNGYVRGPLGAVGTPTYSFSADTNTGMWSSGADTLNFSTGGSERMRITSAGNVGIGTTTPAARLTVVAVTSTSTLGADLITNGAFATNLSGWTIGGAGTGWVASSARAYHDAGNVDTFSQAISLTSGQSYQIKLDIGVTAGTVEVKFNNSSQSCVFTSSFSNNYCPFVAKAGDNTVVITPSSDYSGWIDNISVRQVTASAASALTLLNSDGTTGLEMGSGGSVMYNTAVGVGALAKNNSGKGNSAFGYGSMASFVGGEGWQGSYNSAFGEEALNKLVRGNGNTALGGTALYSLNYGSGNIGIGEWAMGETLYGNSNIAIGNSAMGSYSFRGNYNTAIGNYAMGEYQGGDDGYNVAIGNRAGLNIRYGNYNVVVGDYAAGNNTFSTSTANTILGYGAGAEVGLGGDYNVLIGYQAGDDISSGANNIIIGNNIDAPSSTASNQLNIGNTIYGDLTNGYISLGTTTASSMLTVGATASQQFLVNDLGVVTSGTWQGSAIGVTYGGTGTTTAPVFGQLLMGDGSGGYDLVSTSSLGIASGGSGTVNSGTVGQLAYYSADGTAVSGISGLSWDNGNARLGIGTTSPAALLNVYGSSEQLHLSYDNDTYSGMTVDSSGNLSVQNSGGYLKLNASGIQNYLQIFDSTGLNYIQLTHNGTNGLITTNTGNIELGSAGDLTLGSGVNIVGEGDFDIKGGASSSIITLGDTGKANDDIVAIDASNWKVATSGMINASFDGVGTKVVGSTVDDTSFINAAFNGLTAIDSSNGRIYFRYGGAWHYVNQTGGFQIPSFETAPLAELNADALAEASSSLPFEKSNFPEYLTAKLAPGDLLIPYVDQYMTDGAIHGLYARFDDVKAKLFADAFVISRDGTVTLGSARDEAAAATSTDAEIQIVTATTSIKTAFVVNQAGDGDVVDFKAQDISVMTITDNTEVKVVGTLDVNGRILVCAGGICPADLRNNIDETLGDMGVEGKIIAGSFQGYCEDGFVWVAGSAKYGTMPGFCVMGDLAQKSGTSTVPVVANGELWNNISQGEAQLACQSLGNNYHLLSENEWLTLAENISRTATNDTDKDAIGLQLATASTTYVLSNGNMINNLAGATTEWTDQTVLKAGLPLLADGLDANGWQEYASVVDYKGMSLSPAYYLSSANGIGKILTGDNTENLRGFIRGYMGVYGLDISNAPTAAKVDVGFRCAK